MDTNNEDYIPKLGKCGLSNIGNTCYMNSILQLLLHCRPLVLFLMKKKTLNNNQTIETADYEEYLYQSTTQYLANIERKRRGLDNDDKVTIRKIDVEERLNEAIVVQLGRIVDLLITKGASVIKPVSLKKSVDYKVDTFRGYSQHDAHEYLAKILDLIIEETGAESKPELNNVPESVLLYSKEMEKFNNRINICKEKIKNSVYIQEKKTMIEKIGEITKEKNEYNKLHKDIISKYNGLKYMVDMYKKKYNPFIYQLQTILVHDIECTVCKNQSSNYEDTPILQLYVFDTLDESLNNFTKDEYIDKYKCSVCETERTIIKNCKIWRTPSVLFIHLKRFEVLPNGKIRKNNQEIDIPLNLDLTPYCEQTMNTDNKTKRKYKLTGFSNHLGTMNGGHYTADCLCIVDNKTWYHFDDSRVQRNNNDCIDISNAYILMYELEDDN